MHAFGSTLAKAALALLAGSAHAAYTVQVVESGGDVVASGSGSLLLAGAVPAGGGSTVSFVAPSLGLLHTGTTGNVSQYGGITGPAAFGTGPLTPASSSSGALVGIRSVLGRFFVPQGYVSGAPLTSSAVWSGVTFADLGLTPGTYVWTWPGDSFTVNVIATPPPTPTPVPGLSAGALAALTLGVLALAVRRLTPR